MKQKKGVFFSIDALVALILITLSILVVYPIIKYTPEDNYIQSDILQTLSALKIGEINNSYVQTLIDEGNITNLNNTILEQIGEFYVTDLEIAKQLTSSIIAKINESENIGIWYGTTLLASKNKTNFENAKYIEVDSQIISGIREGESVTGFSSRAYLKNNLKIKYFYLGGYIGEGNISLNINFTGALQEVKIELTASTEFDAYINDIYSGHYQNSSSDFTPQEYDIDAYKSYFQNGSNTLKFVGDNLHISGGYVKITYSDGEFLDSESKKYNFPGIEGLINLYDGFYIPSTINSMNIALHMNTPLITFLTIGNKTVFRNYTNGEETITITNTEILNIFGDYSTFTGKTIPLRLGMENVSYVTNSTLNGDVFSVTDISGSMLECSGSSWFCCWFNDCTTQSGCESCGGILEDKLTSAKEANKEFINTLLNYSGNRIGLIAYSDTADASEYHSLSNDNESLITEVEEWTAGGGTCICCGINKAVTSLESESQPEYFRSVVIMSDGEANRKCSEQNTGSATQDAIEAACNAYNNYGIIINTVGFGNDVDTTTLQAIADCGNGEYYYGDVDTLTEIYKEIAQDLIDLSYSEQTIGGSNNITTILYPDSYIQFNYTEPTPPYGLIISNEKQFDNTYQGTFAIPTNSTLYDIKVISYSGPRWTDIISINNITIFNLSNYGNDYLELGDPYSFSINPSYANSTNTIKITTALSPTNSSEGSISNKIIYTIVKNITSYSSITSLAQGCEWNISFEDDSTITINVPSTYAESTKCTYNEITQTYDENDAMQSAAFNLLKEMDFDLNGKIDVKFSEQDLDISFSEITGIPFGWSTEVQVRKWH